MYDKININTENYDFASFLLWSKVKDLFTVENTLCIDFYLKATWKCLYSNISYQSFLTLFFNDASTFWKKKVVLLREAEVKFSTLSKLYNIPLCLPFICFAALIFSDG